jgi:hypothetical protein
MADVTLYCENAECPDFEKPDDPKLYWQDCTCDDPVAGGCGSCPACSISIAEKDLERRKTFAKLSPLQKARLTDGGTVRNPDRHGNGVASPPCREKARTKNSDLVELYAQTCARCSSPMRVRS